MKKLIIQTLVCTTVICVAAFGLTWFRGGVFWSVLHENLMILGMFGVVGGVISMFAGSGPIGRPERVNSGYSPSMGLILLLSGIANLAMSVWVFNHPRFFNFLTSAFLATLCGAGEIPKKKHYNNGMGWLHFDYPESFVMDPKSHEGEAKWWARLVAPDQSLSIEVWSLGFCSEAIKDEGEFKSPEDFILRDLLKGTPSRTRHKGYDRLIRIDSGTATVIFLKSNADWGKCFQQLTFTFPEGSYETHRPTIMQVIESAVPAFSSAFEQDRADQTATPSDSKPEVY